MCVLGRVLKLSLPLLNTSLNLFILVTGALVIY